VAVLWYVLTSAVVTVDITPAPERLELSGGLIRPSVAGSYLLRPGRYRIVAEHSDYRRLERELTVSGRVNQVFRFSLIPRPGTLSVDTEPLTGAAVEVNGRLVGTTPLGGVELELGSHEVVLRADRHQVHATTVTVERPGEEQHLSVELVPAWAAVTVRSQPSGADVIVDGSSMGITPLTTDLGAGRHRLELRLAGFKPHASTLEVVANEPRTLGVIRLVPDDGILDLESDPAGATVTVDGGFIGQSPLRLALAPGTDHEIKVAKTGHRTQALTVRLEAGARTSRSVRLEPIYGEVEILSTPSGAQVVIDGTAVGLTATTVTLPAVSHTVELRKAGYEPFTATVVPEEGLLETLHATLQPVDDSPASTDPSSLTTSQGATLVRVPAGALVMGASRREPGRRANESLREVEITKPFYLAIHEVTNDQFRQFSPEHSSGQTGGVSLGGGDHPVVAVTWDDAVRFCNWLSEQEGLPPVYVERNGTWTARQPFPDGYRLPTEAEWALAARGAGDAPRKYSWGSDLPLPEGAGNYGDTTAGRILDETLPEYRDGHVATAPVGSFEANPIGLFDLGGNVAEWVHDAYTMYPPSSGDAIRDPTGPAEGEYHVIRGASWMDGRLTRLRLSHRDYGKDAASDVGFRVARNAH
jgi:formylglycine-generating enzyme required for sulfatase activity